MQTFRLILADKFIWLLVIAVVLAMVLPATGSAETAARLAFSAGVFVIFLLHGIRLQPLEVWHGMRNIRLQGAIFAWVFGAMLLAGWGLSLLFAPLLPAIVALGLLYLGCLPSTVQSATSYCAIARGNVAAAVVASGSLNLIAVVLTPLLFALVAQSSGVAVSADAIGRIAMTLLLPFVIGQLIQRWARPFILRHKAVTNLVDKGAIALAVYIAVGSAVAAGLWQHMPADAFAWLLLAVALLLVFAFAGAWLLGGMLALARDDRKTLLFSGGQKSVAIGAPLAAVLFPPAEAGLLILPLVVYHLFQMFVSAPLAVRLADEANDPQTPAMEAN